MDDLDHAKDLEMMQRDHALKNAQNRAPQPDQEKDEFGQIICIDCGDPIPKERLKIHPLAARCVDCKTAHEKWGQR